MAAMTRIFRNWFSDPSFVIVVAQSSMAAAVVLGVVLALRGLS